MPAAAERQSAVVPEVTPSAAVEIEVPSHAEPAPAVAAKVPATAERVIEIEPPSPETRATPSALQIVLPPDLELVETNPDNLRVAASRVEPPPPPRPPRVRPPLPPVSDEPLIQVDTRK